MIVGATIATRDLIRDLREAGFVIVAPVDPQASAELTFDAAVDDEEAASLLPDDFFVDDERCEFEGLLIGEFIAAILAGRRGLAAALAPRVFLNDAHLAAVETALRSERIAA